MRGFLIGLSVSLAFILGCVAAPLLTPTLSAQNAPPGVQRWQYSCRHIPSHANLNALVNEAGRDGWEMVNTQWLENGQKKSCFKRPL